MKIEKRFLVLLVFAYLLIAPLEIWATHIRAGEITARRISNSSLTYEFIIVGYTDTQSSVEFGGGEINFGDGTKIDILENQVFFQQTVELGDNIAVNTFKITHTFQAPGSYTIRFREFNRNAGVVNMANSVDTPFYVETNIVIDPFVGLNNTPILLAPPVDKGAVGAKYLHNPAAYDPDGDSLSYHLVVPLQNINLEVGNYRYPNAPQFYVDFQNAREEGPGTPIFEIDAITGDVTWDAPGLLGEYNFAFIVREWRKINGSWIELGYVTRDMQVIIEESDNKRPELILPPDVCVEAGTVISEIIQGTDPERHKVKLEAYGGPFEVPSSPAVYTPNPPTFQDVTANLRFDWRTNCSHVRERPYDVQFKATDLPPIGPKLVDFGTWNITVIGPAPRNVTSQPLVGRAVEINWDSYTCANAQKIEIWRRVDSFSFTPGGCVVGIPEGSGYELIGEVDRRETKYTDTNNGIGLNPGAKYCYRLVASFPLPNGGTSYASTEVCELVEANSPVITNVTIDETSNDEGQITVKWTPPFDLDVNLFPPPYTYQVVQYQTNNGTGASNVFPIQSDTVLVSTGINTRDRVWSFRVRLFDNTGVQIDSSAIASSVRLEIASEENEIKLSWQANVPWTNLSQRFPTHFIYRNNVNPVFTDRLELIDEVAVTVNGFNYTDDGSFNNQPLRDEIEYCYYVTTQGTYGNPSIKEPLLNNSQIICGQTNDLIPPCPPISFRLDNAFDCLSYLESVSCNFRSFENKLFWEQDEASICKEDVRSFNVYFSESGADESYTLIANTDINEFLHSNIASFKGCYRISSVDRSGNESELSEPVCNDNCPFFSLPNVFTPNNDGKNDAFTPYYSDGSIPNFDLSLCPRFVERVVFRVYDRTGNEIYFYDSNNDFENGIFINWRGNTNTGRILESGTYYYIADVTFDVLDPTKAKKELKGWVQLIR